MNIFDSITEKLKSLCLDSMFPAQNYPAKFVKAKGDANVISEESRKMY